MAPRTTGLRRRVIIDKDASAPTAAAAFYVSTLASYDDVTAMLARSERTGTARLILSAVASQCEGDVMRAEAMLRRAAESASPVDRDYAVDLLVPLLISRGLFARATALLWTAGAPEPDAQRWDAALPLLGDEVLRLRVHQRLALAAYRRNDAAQALEHVTDALDAAQHLSAHRCAAGLHAIAFAIHQSRTGDAEAAWRHAAAARGEAELGGDATFRIWASVVLRELAAERADDAELGRARGALGAGPPPEPYRGRFAGGIADVLQLAWRGDFATVRSALAALQDAARTDGERALARALLGLASVALDDAAAARRFSRQAISASARPERHLSAHELRYRRLARALAAATGEIVGDLVRGRRAAGARFLQSDRDVAALARVPADATDDSIPAGVRGYGRMLLLVRERYARRPAAAPLTAAEVEVLRLADAGRKAPEIARILRRSTHTVRTHLRNASAKLETHGRIATLARARQLGLLR